MLKITIDLPAASIRGKHRYVPHSLNHPIHWSVRYKWTKVWKYLVSVCVMEHRQFIMATEGEKSNVTVIFYVCRRMDRDNAYTAAKPIVDGLKECGVMKDDSEDFLNLTVKTVKVSKIKDQKTQIVIEK